MTEWDEIKKRHIKHELLEQILIWLPRCKDYPEWKGLIIAEHNKYHITDEAPHGKDVLGEIIKEISKESKWELNLYYHYPFCL